MEVHGCLDKQVCSYGANAGYAYDEFDGYIYDESLIGFDKETNLNYNGARDYDPSTGRYPMADPLGLYGGDLSPYLYAKNNPLSFTDPEGLFPNEPQLPSGPILKAQLSPLPPGSSAQRIFSKAPCTCTPKGDPPVMNGLCLLTAGVVVKTGLYVGSNIGIGWGASLINKGLPAIGLQRLTPAVNATANVLKSPALGSVLFVAIGTPKLQETCRAVPVCQD